MNVKQSVVKRRKALPSICVHDLNIQFANAGDARKVREILTKEPLLEVVSDPQTLTEAPATREGYPLIPFNFEAKIYLITRLGTIIGLTYDIHGKQVIRTKVSHYIKEMLDSFQIVQIQIVRGPSHMQLAMLVEPDCICIV